MHRQGLSVVGLDFILFIYLNFYAGRWVFLQKYIDMVMKTAVQAQVHIY